MRLYTCIFIISLLTGVSTSAQEPEALYEGTLPLERVENNAAQTISVQASDSLAQGVKPALDSTKLTSLWTACRWGPIQVITHCPRSELFRL